MKQLHTHNSASERGVLVQHLIIGAVLALLLFWGGVGIAKVVWPTFRDSNVLTDAYQATETIPVPASPTTEPAPPRGRWKAYLAYHQIEQLNSATQTGLRLWNRLEDDCLNYQGEVKDGLDYQELDRCWELVEALIDLERSWTDDDN